MFGCNPHVQKLQDHGMRQTLLQLRAGPQWHRECSQPRLAMQTYQAIYIETYP